MYSILNRAGSTPLTTVAIGELDKETIGAGEAPEGGETDRWRGPGDDEFFEEERDRGPNLSEKDVGEEMGEVEGEAAKES